MTIYGNIGWVVFHQGKNGCRGGVSKKGTQASQSATFTMYRSMFVKFCLAGLRRFSGL
jgi:hypothetical protein